MAHAIMETSAKTHIEKGKKIRITRKRKTEQENTVGGMKMISVIMERDVTIYTEMKMKMSEGRS